TLDNNAFAFRRLSILRSIRLRELCLSQLAQLRATKLLLLNEKARDFVEQRAMRPQAAHNTLVAASQQLIDLLFLCWRGLPRPMQSSIRSQTRLAHEHCRCRRRYGEIAALARA